MADWRSIVASVAPILGTALGGPLGGLAGTVLGKFLGIDTTTAPTDAQLAAAVQGLQPADYIKLKQAENDFKQHMADLGIQEEQLTFQDRDSARKREMSVNDRMPQILAVIILAGFFATIYYMFTTGLKNMEPSMAALAGTLVGYVFNEAKSVTSYYFGGSYGSEQKDTMLYNSTPITAGGK